MRRIMLGMGECCNSGTQSKYKQAHIKINDSSQWQPKEKSHKDTQKNGNH